MTWSSEDIVYCSNVHPSSSLTELLQQLVDHAIPLKKARKLPRLSLGLWLNQAVVEEMLNANGQVEQLLQLFEAERLSVLTLNAFPQQQFHGQKIKTRVYQPDWSCQQRLDYTLALIALIERYPQIFQQQLTISTLPLGYKSTWTSAQHQQATIHLHQVAQALAQLKQRTGQQVRLCLEMEPDCVLESSDEMQRFFIRDLLIAEHSVVADHLGVCFDICDQAVMHENIPTNLALLLNAGISIGKVQVSNALAFNNQDKAKALSLLTAYYSSPYLHQVKVNTGGRVLSFADLNSALVNQLTVTGESRVHFHLPINQARFEPPLETTQADILALLDFCQHYDWRPHLEIETYTWSVLAKNADSKQLNALLLDEINWLTAQLAKRKLLT